MKILNALLLVTGLLFTAAAQTPSAGSQATDLEILDYRRAMRSQTRLELKGRGKQKGESLSWPLPFLCLIDCSGFLICRHRS